jgi:hemerythrin superfamily protein
MNMSTNLLTIRDHLLEDHQHIEKLLEEVLEAFRVDDRSGLSTLWTRFERQLLSHLTLEERELIPALMHVNRAAAQGLLNEHAHIRGRLAELGAGVDLHIVRLDGAREFIEELRAHARHEDDLLYRWADEHLEESVRRVLLRALVDAAVARIGKRAH